METALGAILHQHGWPLLTEDIKAYPSRKFKQGVNVAFMEPFKDLLLQLEQCTDRVLQTVGEKAFDHWNGLASSAVKLACKKSQVKYEIWRKEVVLVLRIMLAHIKIKKKQWEEGKGAHPAWLVIFFKAIKEALHEQNEQDMEPEEPLEPDEEQTNSGNMPGLPSGKENSLENKVKIMAGRASGKAHFPNLHLEEPLDEELPESESEAGEHIASELWDPATKTASRLMQDGRLFKSIGFQEGPNGFLQAVFEEGGTMELELTNDLLEFLETPIIDPKELKAKAKAKAKTKNEAIDNMEGEKKTRKKTTKAKAKREKKEADEAAVEEPHSQEGPVEEAAEEVQEKEAAEGSKREGRSSSRKLLYSRTYHLIFKQMLQLGKEGNLAKSMAREEAKKKVADWMD